MPRKQEMDKTIKTVRNRTSEGRRRAIERTADPYRDLDVIDSRAPRATQATIGALSLVAFLVDWWPLLAILAAQLFVGLRFGRRYCLPCVTYFELIQPRVGEGPTEDSRPPRFANQVGLAFLSAASVAHVIGWQVAGWVLGLMVATLALLAAATGFCVGCEIYKLGAILRGNRRGRLDEIDWSELGGNPQRGMTVLFTHPLCTECHDAERELRGSGERVVEVDVRARPDLARRYGISVVPTIVRLGAGGEVEAASH